MRTVTLASGQAATVIEHGPSNHPNAVNRRAFLAHVINKRRRKHPEIYLAEHLRSFIKTHPLFNALPSTGRLPNGELEVRAVVLFGPFVGRWLIRTMRRSMSFTQFEALMNEVRPEERPQFDITKSDVIMEGAQIVPRETDLTTFHAEQRRELRLGELSLQSEERISFAEFLEGRAGEVNPRRMYRQWLKEQPHVHYTPHMRCHQDAKLRLGKQAAEYIWKTPKATRKAMANYMRSL